MTAERPDVSTVMAPLKDFQRRTAEYAFQRLYLDDETTRRFLIADEAGLGKTLVAKGVIAQAMDHLWDDVDRIDVVYVCSNASIARQNINRLVISADREQAFPSRITLLPQYVNQLDENKVNFISFTPGTSFDLKSRGGLKRERVMLYHILKDVWDFSDMAPINVLQFGVNYDNFRATIRTFDEQIDTNLKKRFLDAVADRPDLRETFDRLCGHYRRYDSDPSDEIKNERRRLVGELRGLLASVCVEALEPDLIILDEFQKFKDLVNEESDEGELAHRLFNYADENTAARVLLLSATPYKMYTLRHEQEDSHFEGFYETLDFLTEDEAQVRAVAEDLEDYRESLYRLADGRSNDAEDLKAAIERHLRKVMVRTERVSAPDNGGEGMFEEIQALDLGLEPSEIHSYVELEGINELLEAPQAMNYWKSAPYLLSLMNNYKIKKQFRDRLTGPRASAELAKRVREANHLFLSADEVDAYDRIDPRNARLRSLIQQVVETGAWQCLWVPPALPYHGPGEPFDNPGLAGLTKRLVFSSWVVVPKTIAALVSYEVERRILEADDRAMSYFEGRESRGNLLRITEDGGRLTGMPLFSMLYPSPTLAELGDPLRHGCRSGAQSPRSLQEVRSSVSEEIHQQLTSRMDRDELSEPTGERESTADERWYWVAPLWLDLLEHPQTTRQWLEDRELAPKWEATSGSTDDGSPESKYWPNHVDRLRELGRGELSLGATPDDLFPMLVDMAIGGPATCALRALSRIDAVDGDLGAPAVRTRAGQIGWGFRSLFNNPEKTAVVRGVYPEEPYWRRTLEYCCAGNLQAMLDEWVHMLYDFGLQDKSEETVLERITERITETLNLRTATASMDEVLKSADGFTLDANRIRCHFALQFRKANEAERREVIRADQVRKAFNSPLWPFVLATTSIGQEGLDFHPYCHAVVHWNLPSNPVDLEQRDGRVHRFKGHAVRKNVARKFGSLVGDGLKTNDVWSGLFDHASERRPPDTSELVPYWLFTNDAGPSDVIERHVPVLPMSRETRQLDDLKRSLVLYRMALGQSRQEDLISYLSEHLDVEKLDNRLSELQIDLSPPA